MGLTAMLIITATMLVFMFGAMAMIVKCLHKVPHGKALIIDRVGGPPHVTFRGGVVLPWVHKAEELDLTTKVVHVELCGRDGLHCRDHYSVDLALEFFVRVGKTEEDILRVADSFGAARTSDPEALRELFAGKFREATAMVVEQLELAQLRAQREDVRDEILKIIGVDLAGFVLDDLAISTLRVTPIENLDPDDVLDAQAIRKCTESTAKEKVRTNEIVRDVEKLLAEQRLAGQTTLLKLERQRAEIEAAIDKLKGTMEVEPSEPDAITRFQGDNAPE